MATMNVSLSAELVDCVEGEVASGAYTTTSEVVRDTLRLLRREQAAHDEKIEILRREIGIGVEQARAGRGVRALCRRHRRLARCRRIVNYRRTKAAEDDIAEAS